MHDRKGACVVYIIDDQSSVRRAMSRLMRLAGLGEATFSSIEEFVAADVKDDNACVVADVRLSERGGLELSELLSRQGEFCR